MVTSPQPHKVAVVDDIVVTQSGSFGVSSCTLLKKLYKKISGELIWKINIRK